MRVTLNEDGYKYVRMRDIGPGEMFFLKNDGHKRICMKTDEGFYVYLDNGSQYSCDNFNDNELSFVKVVQEGTLSVVLA